MEAKAKATKMDDNVVVKLSGFIVYAVYCKILRRKTAQFNLNSLETKEKSS